MEEQLRAKYNARTGLATRFRSSRADCSSCWFRHKAEDESIESTCWCQTLEQRLNYREQCSVGERTHISVLTAYQQDSGKRNKTAVLEVRS